MPRAPGPAMPPVRAVMPSLRSASRPRDVRRSFFPEAARSASLRRELLLLMGGGGVRGAYPNALLSSTPPPRFLPLPEAGRQSRVRAGGAGSSRREPPSPPLTPTHTAGEPGGGAEGEGRKRRGTPWPCACPEMCSEAGGLRRPKPPPSSSNGLLREVVFSFLFPCFFLFFSFLFFSFFLFLSLQMKFSAALSYFSACDVNGT